MANTTDTKILTTAGKALLAQVNAEESPFKVDKLIFANIPDLADFPQPEDGVPTDYVVAEKAVERRGRLGPNVVIYSTTLTSGEGPFEFNWTGAYSTEKGVLIAIDHHKLTPKTENRPGIAGNTLVRSLSLEYKDIAEITNITVDATTWQYDSTKRLAKMDSDAAQANIDQNGKDWFIEDGFLVTPQSGSFKIKAGAGYVSGNRVSTDYDSFIQVLEKPAFIYVDAWREGTPTGEWETKYNLFASAAEHDDRLDESTTPATPHFVCKIAQVMADGSVRDLRPQGESATREWVDKREIVQTGMLSRTPNFVVGTESSIIGEDVAGKTALQIDDVFFVIVNPPLSGKVTDIDSANNTVEIDGTAYALFNIAISWKSALDIESFGVTGSGIETKKIQKAFDAAFRLGLDVDLNGLKITTANVNLWTGVGLRNGTLIKGAWNTQTVTNQTSVVKAYGGNNIQVHIDGNYRNIPDDAIGTPTLYLDVELVSASDFIVGPEGKIHKGFTSSAVISDLSHISRSTFRDATGTQVGGGGVRGAAIDHCFFGKYRDHAVYASGHEYNDWLGVADDNNSSGILIHNNVVQNSEYNEVGNGAFKLRNQVSHATISSNAFELTGPFAFVDACDQYNDGSYRNISLIGNVGCCSTFLTMGHSDGWSETISDKGTALVSGNIASCTSNPLRLRVGNAPVTGRLKFIGNQLLALNGDVITAYFSDAPDGSGSFEFTGNEFINTDFQISSKSKWKKLIISRNGFISEKLNRYGLRFIYDGGDVTNADTSNTQICDNDLIGYLSLMLVNAATSGEYGPMSRGNAYIKGNSVRKIDGSQGTLLSGDDYGSEAPLQGKTIVGENDLHVNTKKFTNVVRSEIDASELGVLDVVVNGATSTFTSTANQYVITQCGSVITVNFKIAGSFTDLSEAGGVNELKVIGFPFIKSVISVVPATVHMKGVKIDGVLMPFYDGNVRFNIIDADGNASMLNALDVTVDNNIEISGQFSFIAFE